MTGPRNPVTPWIELWAEGISRAGEHARAWTPGVRDAAGHLHDIYAPLRGEPGDYRDAPPKEPHPHGLTPEVLYDFAQNEILQWERVYRLGFRYAEHLLDAARKRQEGAQKTPENKILELTMAGSGEGSVSFPILNRTDTTLMLSFMVSEFAGKEGAPIALNTRFACDPRTLVPDQEVKVTFHAALQGKTQAGDYSGEIVARGGALEVCRKVVIHVIDAQAQNEPPQRKPQRAKRPKADAV